MSVRILAVGTARRGLTSFDAGHARRSLSLFLSSLLLLTTPPLYESLPCLVRLFFQILSKVGKLLKRVEHQRLFPISSHRSPGEYPGSAVFVLQVTSNAYYRLGLFPVEKEWIVFETHQIPPKLRDGSLRYLLLPVTTHFVNKALDYGSSALPYRSKSRFHTVSSGIPLHLHSNHVLC